MNITQLHDCPVVAVDTETTGVEWTRHQVFGVAISVPDCAIEQLVADPLGAPIKNYYFDVRRRPDIYEALREVAPRIQRVVAHHAKFDLHMLLNDGAKIDPERVDCTMIRASLIDEHLLRYDLDSLAQRCLGIGKDEDIYKDLAQLFGGRATRNAQMDNLHRAPVELVARYAKQDTEVALRLWAWQEGEIERQNLGQVWGLEKRLFPHVLAMERHGIRIDVERAQLQAELLEEQADRVLAEIKQIAGFPVNPNPSGDMIKLFKPKWDKKRGVWVAVDGTVLETTPGGKPSLNADALRRMRHPAAGKILQVRKMLKTAGTFIRGHMLGHEHRGRVHPNINQTKGDDTGGTGTGRLSYTKPALQQIPSRDREVAERVRQAFLPDEGCGWAHGDLDQHELRIFHHYVNNPDVVRTYRENPDTDGHQMVADMTGLPRDAPADGGPNAKQLGLGAVFNMGRGEMASEMGLPWEWASFQDRDGRMVEYKKPGPAAEEVLDHFYRVVPGIKEMATKATAIARTRGYVRTMFGRHIRFPDGMFVYKASGLVYQGSSADLVKLDIINVCEYLAAECPGGALLLSIHDEQNISIPRGPREVEHVREIQRLIQERPGCPVNLRIPIRADFGALSENWWEATQAEPITMVG